jgi:hypothetical protein
LLIFYQCVSFINVPEFRPFLFNHFNTVVSNFVVGPDESTYDNVAGGSAPPFTVTFTQTLFTQSSSAFYPVRMFAVLLYGMRVFFDNLTFWHRSFTFKF